MAASTGKHVTKTAPGRTPKARKDGGPPLQPPPKGPTTVPASRLRAAVKKVISERRRQDAEA